MSPAKLWLRIYLAGFAVVVAMLIVTLFTPIAYGDLSRIGYLSETEFGWRRPPPPIPEESMRAVPVDQADILVIGDSFSMTYMWQSELVRAGYKVTTIYWGQYSETMCSDLQRWLEKAGFRGKLVIFESVERLLKDRMKRSTQCAHMSMPFESREKPLIPTFKAVPGFAFNSGSPLLTGLTTLLHTRTALATGAETQFGFGARVRNVPDGCAQFSSRRCDMALFFDEDLENGPLDAEDFARMKQFNADHASIPFIWMVIPDKTTTYLDPDKSRGFRDPFQAAKLGPDLFAMTAENRMKVKDLYFPNDTHLSMHGQAILGRRMLEEVRKVLPPPAGKSP
jgi:hypothetical protein